MEQRMTENNVSFKNTSNAGSVPDPDPYVPYVFIPPGSASASVSHKYGSVSFPFLIKSVEGTEIMVAK
jgi:hypothetical protein